MITGDTPLTFVYLFPVLAVILTYSDFKVLLQFFIVFFSINVVSVLVKIVMFGATSANDIANYEIQLLATLIVGILSLISIRIIQDINRKRMAQIEEQNKKSVEVLNAIKEATEALSTRVEDIESQSESAQLSIEEIATGTSDVAETIQTQLVMSNGISDELDALTNISKEIQERFADTHELSQLGMKNVNDLSDSTKLVAES